jgi:hypothetical protein
MGGFLAQSEKQQAWGLGLKIGTTHGNLSLFFEF